MPRIENFESCHLLPDGRSTSGPLPNPYKLEFDKNPWVQFTNFDKPLSQNHFLWGWGEMSGSTFKTCCTKFQLPFYQSTFLRLKP